MSPTPNRASNSASSKTRSKNVTLDLTTARKMLPLVRNIVSEIVGTRKHLDHLTTEQEALDDMRRSLDWTGRQRRYTVHDEVNRAEHTLSQAVRELNGLGVKLLDPTDGRVDFPTKINGRPAAFCWQLGQEELDQWHYSGEAHTRSLPKDWQYGTPLRTRSES